MSVESQCGDLVSWRNRRRVPRRCMGAGTVLWGSSPAVARGRLVFVGKEGLCWGAVPGIGHSGLCPHFAWLHSHGRFLSVCRIHLGFPGGSAVKKSTANAGDEGSIPGWRRSPRGGNGNPLQYSCLGSPTDREASATVCGVTKELARTEQLNSHLWNPCDGTFCLASWMFHFSPGCRGCPWASAYHKCAQVF